MTSPRLISRFATLLGAPPLALVAMLAGCSSASSSPGPSPIVSVSPASLTFSNTQAGTTSAVQTVNVSNSGTAALAISGVTLGGTNPASFAIAANTCSNSVAVGAQCTLSVNFTPSSGSAYSATLSIADNASGSPQTVALSGTGTAVPTLSLTPSSLNLGTNLVNSLSSASVTVTNTSNIPITFGTRSITGSNAASFTFGNPGTSPCGTTLAGSATCNLVVNFTTPTVGPNTATLNLPSNASGSPQTIALSGAGATESNRCSGTKLTSPATPAPTASFAGTAFTGKVMAGSLPVIGSSVQVYAAGQTGNGSAPTALLATALTTDANGSFSVPAAFTCPYSNSVLYVVARGGKAGPGGAANAGIVLTGVLGTCNSLTSGTAVVINEITTAVTAWSMSQFLSPGAQMGASATNSAGTNGAAGIVLAAGTFASLANITSGTTPGAYFPGNGTLPTTRIGQAADLLNACIVSSGSTSTACTQLYKLTATATAAPANTFDAMLNLVRNPATNVAALYTLSTASSAYAGLPAAPNDWTLFVTFTGGGMDTRSPNAVSIDSQGHVWTTDYAGAASAFTNTGSPITPYGFYGENIYHSYGGAVDVNDTEWVTNTEGNVINNGFGSISLVNSSGAGAGTFAPGGVYYPEGIAFDTSGIAWIADYGDSTVSLITSAGVAAPGAASGYTSSQMQFPVAVATDAKCNAFVANQSSNTITFVSADGSTFGSFVVKTTGSSGPSGIAVDGSGYVWVADYYGDAIELLSPTGTVLSGATGFTGGGIEHPQGIAVDGSGSIWTVSYRSPAGVTSALTALAGSGAATPGAILSGATGYGLDANLIEPYSVAIDASGNLWVPNSGISTLTEFIGLAAPVKTPLLGPVRVP